MNLDKKVVFRIPEALNNLAHQTMIGYAIKKNIKCENFSEYIRRLIKEDHDRYREELRKQFEQEVTSK